MLFFLCFLLTKGKNNLGTPVLIPNNDLPALGIEADTPASNWQMVDFGAFFADKKGIAVYMVARCMSGKPDPMVSVPNGLWFVREGNAII